MQTPTSLLTHKQFVGQDLVGILVEDNLVVHIEGILVGMKVGVAGVGNIRLKCDSVTGNETCLWVITTLSWRRTYKKNNCDQTFERCQVQIIPPERLSLRLEVGVFFSATTFLPELIYFSPNESKDSNPPV